MATATDEQKVESPEDEEAIRGMNATADHDGTSLEEDADVEEEESGQMAIAGTRPTLTASAGGRRPDASRTRVRAITLPVIGQFEKGEKLRITMDVVVKKVEFDDEEDAHGKIVRTWRTHTFTPDAVIDIGPVSE